MQDRIKRDRQRMRGKERKIQEKKEHWVSVKTENRKHLPMELSVVFFSDRQTD